LGANPPSPSEDQRLPGPPGQPKIGAPRFAAHPRPSRRRISKAPRAFLEAPKVMSLRWINSRRNNLRIQPIITIKTWRIDNRQCTILQMSREQTPAKTRR